MKRCEANRRDELPFRHASLRGEGAHEDVETRQLLVLCFGMAGLLAADALVWIYFWMI
jgi:hypothetical protein